MMKVGDRVPLELGGEAEITQLLGQGGQGLSLIHISEPTRL